MKQIIYYLAAGMLLLAGLGLLLLANIGFISLRQPFVSRKGADLYPQPQPVAFVNVQVVPMDSERVLANQVVIVRDGLIERIGPASSVELPVDALVVDGRGGYLMPGLTDMHVHIKDENELLLYVAHGVTTVRDMWGTTGIQLWMGFPDQRELRAKTLAGELLGPTIFTTGPVMEGEPKTSPIMSVTGSPEAAVASVREQKAQGFDFIKVYDNLAPEVYDAILQTAREEGLPVVGHAPRRVRLENILAGGQQTIEHLSGYIDSDAADYLVPEEQAAKYVAMTREAGVWVCPTIGVYQMHVPDAELATLEARPEMAYVSPRMKILWRRMFRPGAMQNISYQGDYPARIDEIFTQLTGILHENGVGIILGTDANNPYVVPGVSLLDELDYAVSAGLSPYETLLAGTRNPTEALGRLDESGTVSEGKQADLLLLSDNPLDEVTNVRSRLGVMVRGHWLPETELRAMLAQMVDSYSPSLLDRAWPLIPVALGLYLVLRPWIIGKKKQVIQPS